MFHLSQGIEKSGSEILKALYPWQQITFFVIFVCCIFFFLLFVILPVRVKKGNSSNIGIICGAISICSLFVSFFALISFSYGNSAGWLKGLLLFLAIPIGLGFASLIGVWILNFLLFRLGRRV